MNNKVCALYFLIIFYSSIIRATLHDLWNLLGREKFNRNFIDDETREEKLSEYRDIWIISTAHNDGNNYNVESDRYNFQRPHSSQTYPISPYENLQNSYRNPQIFIENFPNNLRTNFDLKNIFLFNKPTIKFTNKKSTTGLDVNLPFNNELIDKFKDQIKTVYPGTLWCGGGDIANRTSDLGFFASTDYCCKVHDMCPLYIKSRNYDFGLQNGGLFTRSHCDCDREFYYCLKKTNTFISNKIGFTYFNILGPQCFREEHPIITCAIKHRNRCYSYVVDDKSIKTWQWFDNKLY